MDKREIIKNTKLFLFDMDGTLYLGDRLYDFTKELLQTIRDSGRQYMFMTNNSSKSAAAYVEKLAKMGIAATTDDMQTSSQATAFYLKKHHAGQRLYVAGTASLKAELVSHGFTLTENINETDCIVMGFDTELTFQKLKDVSFLLCTRDIPYIATNPDYVCPTEFGSVPDCGSVADMLFNVSGKRPVFIGKPSPLMPQLAMEKMGVTPQETAVIGDRIYTDVKSGLNADCTAILVLSGEATEKDLAASDVKPTLVMQSAKEIMDILKD